MLDSLRKGSQTWVAKLLMGILVLSFGVWGISGTLLSNIGGSDAVLTVGKVKVTSRQYRLAYDREMAQLSQQFNTRLTPQQAQMLGVQNRVLSQLAASAALDQLGRKMGLGVSEDQLARYIAQDPTFHDGAGNFNRQTFQAVLQSVGMSEKDYIEDQKNVAIRSQLVDAIGNEFKPPVTLVNAFLQYRDETRDIDYLLISKDNVAPVKTPSDKDLQAFFDKHKSDYRAPEYRKIAYVALTPKAIADPGVISDDAAKQYYESHKQDYGTPERRTIDQLTFSSQAAAKAAEEKLKSGTSFDDLVKQEGKKPSDVRLGTYTSTGLPDQKLAAAAFAVKQNGGTTGVVDGAFGPVILRVSDIQPAHPKPFADVEKGIKEQLAVAKANDKINDVHDAYEDARAGGDTLQEAAKKVGLKPVVVDAVDESGDAPDGKPVAGLPEQKDLLKAAFINQQGDEIPSLNYGSNGYLWVEVLGVDKAHDRALKDVKNKVVADWTADQYTKEIAKKADEIKKEVEGGKSLKAIAASLHSEIETKDGIKRTDTDAVFGQDAAEKAFASPKGVVAVANAGDDPTNKIVLHVTGVHQGTASGYDSLQPQQLSALTNQAGNALLGQMVGMLQKNYGISVNQKLAQQAMDDY